jgi:hypothetical protein
MNRNADTLQQFLDELHPLERKAIATATAQDWMDALNRLRQGPDLLAGAGRHCGAGIRGGIHCAETGSR